MIIKIFLASVVVGISWCTAATSKTFLSLRPITTYPLFSQQPLFDANQGFKVSATTFYQASARSNNFHRYFMPQGKDELVVQGVTGAGEYDISAAWLAIAAKNPGADIYELHYNAYKSVLSLAPSFRAYGSVLEASQACKLGGVTLIGSIRLPVMQLRTTAGLHENIVNTNVVVAAKSDIGLFEIKGISPGAVAPSTKRTELPSSRTNLSATQAFNNAAYLSRGKIASTDTVRTGLGDVELALGAQIASYERWAVGMRAFALVPTADKATGSYLFEPLLGSNGHWGTGAALINRYEITGINDVTLRIQNEARYDYFFPAHELRTYDLVGRPWSRYVQFLDDPRPDAPADRRHSQVSGPSVLTRKTTVMPQDQVQVSTACSLAWDRSALTVGHQYFYKRAEKLKLKDSLGQGAFIALSSFGHNDAGVGPTNIEDAHEWFTNKNTSIHDHPYGWGGANPQKDAARMNDLALHELVTDQDLDLASAQQSAQAAHVFYADFTFEWVDDCTWALAGQYELSTMRHRPDTYTVSCKLTKMF